MVEKLWVKDFVPKIKQSLYRTEKSPHMAGIFELTSLAEEYLFSTVI